MQVRRNSRSPVRSMALAAGLIGFVSATTTLANETAPDEKTLSGMSLLGNDEAPKSLVIVPWKSADLGDDLDPSRVMQDPRAPLDRAVLERELDYFEIRTGNAQRTRR